MANGMDSQDQGGGLFNILTSSQQSTDAVSADTTLKEDQAKDLTNRIHEVKISSSGDLSLKTTADVAAKIMQDLRNTDAYKKKAAMLDKMEGLLSSHIGQLEQQNKFVTANPLLATLARVAGGAALYDKHMPGLVRGLGAEAIRSYPTVGEISAQESPLIREMLGVEAERGGEEREIFSMAHQLAGDVRLDAEEQRRVIHEKAQEERQARDDRQNFENKWDDRVMKGDFDVKSFLAEAKRTGLYTAEQLQGLSQEFAGKTQTYATMRDMLGEAEFKKKIREERAKAAIDVSKEKQIIDMRESAAEKEAKYKQGLKDTDQKKKLTAAQTNSIDQINQALITADSLKKLIEPRAKKEGTGTISQIGSKLEKVGEQAKYKFGILPEGSEVDDQILALSNLFTVMGAQPYMRGSRNYRWIEDIKQHLPNPTDTDRLKMEKLNIIMPKLESFRASMKAEANPAVKPLTDSELSTIRSLPAGKGWQAPDGTIWVNDNGTAKEWTVANPK